jgi:hypothetical protein
LSIYTIDEKFIPIVIAINRGQLTNEELEKAVGKVKDADFKSIADAIGCFIKNFKSEEEAFKKEIMNLAARAKKKLSIAVRLTGFLYYLMRLQSEEKIETPRNLIQIKKCPKKVIIKNESEFLNWAQKNNDDLLRYQAPEPDKLKIAQLIKEGKEIPFTEIIQTEKLELK